MDVSFLNVYFKDASSSRRFRRRLCMSGFDGMSFNRPFPAPIIDRLITAQHVKFDALILCSTPEVVIFSPDGTL